jgi:radical SAM family uncharacterized protein
MRADLEKLLPLVQKPARYTGGEFGEIKKKDADTRIALCFPDVYEIGMSNLGVKILYGTLNAIDGVACERVFEPWGDMASLMRERGVPLCTLESGTPLAELDMIGFSVGYEMSFVGILNMLRLAGIPLRSADRDGLAPLVFAGGACMFNCEPLADFIDLAVIGEGEYMDTELVELYREARREGLSKREFLLRAAKIEGVYVPSLYEVEYGEDGTISRFEPLPGAPEKVVKRVVNDLDAAYYPVDGIVPSTEIVHDRSVLELFRGCIRGCRFCQAGFTCRPVRSRSVDLLTQQGIESMKCSGYREISLSSLSSSDYPGLEKLCDDLLEWCEPNMASLSLPSLRADNFSMELMKKVQKVRRSGLTFAPEAGSQRLRDVINKNVTEEDVLTSCRTAFEGGWSAVKLYFMIGLPTETDEDVLAIADLAYKVLGEFKRHATNKARGARVTVSAACFVPKPMTPFQWEGQDTRAEFSRKIDLLKAAMPSKALSFSWHEPGVSFIEAVLARGDRRLAPVLERVLETAGGLQAWDEYFSLDKWEEAFAFCGVDPDFYAVRERAEDEILPWSRISAGVTDEFLLRERRLSRECRTTPDCRARCSGCGADRLGGKCHER